MDTKAGMFTYCEVKLQQECLPFAKWNYLGVQQPATKHCTYFKAAQIQFW